MHAAGKHSIGPNNTAAQEKRKMIVVFKGDKAPTIVNTSYSHYSGL
jgi:hypothetical protein